MVYIIRWVLLGLCSAMGMALIPIYPATGCILALGCFLILAIDIDHQEGGQRERAAAEQTTRPRTGLVAPTYVGPPGPA